MTWPVILAAVPIGFGAGYLRKRSLEDQLHQVAPELEMQASEQIKLIFAKKRDYVRGHLGETLPAQVKRHLEEHVAQHVGSLERQVFSMVSRADVADAVSQLDFRLARLYEHGGLVEHPGNRSEVVFPEGPTAIKALREHFAGEDERLDLSVGRYYSGIAQLLRDLTANVRVRLLISVSREEEPEFRAELERELCLHEPT